MGARLALRTLLGLQGAGADGSLRSRIAARYPPRQSSRAAWGARFAGPARWLVVAACQWVASAYAASPAADIPRVLILHSNQRPVPAQVIIEDTLRTVLPQAYGSAVELYSEYLDSEWTDLRLYGASQADFLRQKYEQRGIDVIIVDAVAALQFMSQYRDRAFPGVPVVHLAVASDRRELALLPAGFVGHPEDNDPTPTLQLALHLHPDANRLVMIEGAGPNNVTWDRRMRRAVGALDRRIDVEFVVGLPTPEVLRRVAALPKRTVVYTPGYFTDGAGEVTTPRQVIERIAAASSAPVYGAFETTIGSGIVGGYVSPYEDQAKGAAVLVAQLLGGTPPSELSSAVARRLPVVDWRQVQRWGIDERSLPAETAVRFREPSAWQRYRTQIEAGIAIFGLQAALIAALLFEMRARRRTSMALAESEKQMNLAASAARLSFWSWDASSGRIDVSRAWSRAKKRPPDAIALKDIIGSAYAADREPLERSATRALTTGEELDVEYRAVDGTGALRWIAARGRVDPSDSQRLRGVALDVTERKASELRAAQDHSALRHMSRISMGGQLSAAIAHQLNQPLAAILGNAETARKLLDRDRIDTVELRAICDDILSEDRRAADIIRRLSELYKRGDMQMSAVDVNSLVRETLDLLRTELLVRQVTSSIELQAGLPPVEGSRVQLQQVVLNLALNAAEALHTVTGDERMLTIRTESKGSCVLLHVVDNGPGVSPDQVDRVFEAFWSTKDAGMGMGLAICRSIVTAHRGSITVANGDPGGAAFRVELPAGPRA
jgi:C4-dicarboxylate-specific signal transduction histidine kinase/ABC-type uncharacterized transport system substrate-binding protein